MYQDLLKFLRSFVSRTPVYGNYPGVYIKLSSHRRIAVLHISDASVFLQVGDHQMWIGERSSAHIPDHNILLTAALFGTWYLGGSILPVLIERSGRASAMRCLRPYKDLPERTQ